MFILSRKSLTYSGFFLFHVDGDRFNDAELYTTLDDLDIAFFRGLKDELYYFNSSSGLSSLSKYTDGMVFWQAIQSQLLILPRKSSLPITKIILMGERATNPKFLEVLRDALSDMKIHYVKKYEIKESDFDVKIDVENIADPLFAAARGAALYARWRQEAPLNCEEMANMECEKKRESERRKLGQQPASETKEL